MRPLSVSPQRRLPATLRAALGDALAWSIMPRSFCLPEELGQLQHTAAAASGQLQAGVDELRPAGEEAGREAAEAAGDAPAAGNSGDDPTMPMQQQAVACSRQGFAVARASSSVSGASTSGGGCMGGDALWVLKTSQHLGRGLQLVSLKEVRGCVCSREWMDARDCPAHDTWEHIMTHVSTWHACVACLLDGEQGKTAISSDGAVVGPAPVHPYPSCQQRGARLAHMPGQGGCAHHKHACMHMCATVSIHACGCCSVYPQVS